MSKKHNNFVPNISKRKGIILAGGSGSRLYPATLAISKQLLPVYDKPMIYYPLCTLMLAGIREILIITDPQNKNIFQRLLGNGNDWGISIKFEEQAKPEGLAQAFLIGEKFLAGCPSVLILGDNLFHGDDLNNRLQKISNNKEGGTIFAYPVKDPERYGVPEFDENYKVINIEEKPKNPKSRYAITGLYFFDKTVVERAKLIKPSLRNELEITDLNILYLKDNLLNVEVMNRGMTWLDTGTSDSLHEASSYVRTLEHRQGLKIGCPEEVAWRMNWIDDGQLKLLAQKFKKINYGKYLNSLHLESK
tara:strand:+ start:530 stop:1444 length:915 start_codon:yes stop_codon:yes gene_type:complete